MKLLSRRTSRALIALLSSSTLLFTSFPALADEGDNLENAAASLELELSGINQDLLAISDEIETAEMQIEITKSEIQRTEDSLQAAIKDEETQYDTMKARIKYMYETGNASLLEMLFSAEDLADFINKADFIQSISAYDRNMLLQLQNIRNEIDTNKLSLQEQQDSMVSIHKELQSKQDELQRKADATSIDLNEYKAQLALFRQKEAEERARAEAQAKAEAQAQAQAQAEAEKETSPESPAPSPEESVPESTPEPEPEYNGGGSTQVSGSELDLFAALLQCEAHAEYRSMLAVATVIMNRVQSPLFPNSITDVIYASGQFEPVWTGRLDRVLSQGAIPVAYQVAQDAINGARLAEVSDCYFFLYAGATSTPGVNIGDNVFFQSW